MNSRNTLKEIQLLYMQTGNIDVYNKMMARKLEMDRDDAIEARKLKEEEKRRKEAEAEQMAWAVGIVMIVLFIGAVGWGVAEITELCAKTKCGR